MARKNSAAAAQPAPPDALAVARTHARGDAAEWCEPGSLALWPDNPKKATPAEIRGVADSIIRFGFGAPLVARRADRELIAGHTRLQAVLMLPRLWKAASPEKRKAWSQDAQQIASGDGLVPVRFLDISADDAHILALADNELGADNDEELLLARLREMKDADREAAGYEILEYAKLVKKLRKDEDDERGGRQLGGDLTYSVVVECQGEEQQAELLARLEGEGFTCKPLVS